jgi:cell division septation protein DedD
MGVFGSRSAGTNLDEFEHLLRAERARVDPSTQKAVVEPARRLEVGALRPEFGASWDDQGETLGALEEPQHPDLDGIRNLGSPVPEELRSKDWTLNVATLAVVGVGIVGAAFALKSGAPGLPKQSPFIAAAQGPTKEPPNEGTIAAPDDVGAILKDSTQAGRVKVVAATGMANEPPPSGAPTKPEKAALATKIQQAAFQTESAAPGATQQATTPAATVSAGWSVQLAAPKSEAEAKNAVERLNAKFASDLNGSSIGVHKAVVNGETIYRLRVVGLSKADAAALCARLKGDKGECFIAK